MTTTKAYTARKAFPGTTLTIEAYVPNRDRHGKELTNATVKAWVESIERTVCELTGGGCTTYGAVGTWNGSREETTIVRGSVPDISGRRALALDRLAVTLGAFADDTDQELAGFTIDGEWYFAAPAGDVGQPSVEDAGR